MIYAPFQAAFRATLPLALCPYDEQCGEVPPKWNVAELEPSYSGKTILVVGGTKGIGKAVADIITKAGGRVIVVGRSAVDGNDSMQADLSTVQGCKDLEQKMYERLVKAEVQFNFVVFSIGVWPEATNAYTSDGIHKVLAIDLLSRHLVMKALVANRLLHNEVRVMSILASCQAIPKMVVDTKSFHQGINAATTPGAVIGLSGGFHLMLCTSIANDAWLQGLEKTLPKKAHCMGTFPGVLATDLMANTLSAWMVPLAKMGMAPIADSDENMGLQHAMILASDNVTKRRVSYWAAPRLEAREANSLAMAQENISFIWDELEALRKREPPEPVS